MAGGQGFKGNVGTGEGVYISVVMDAEDAIVKAQQLDGKVDNLTVSMRELEGQVKVTAAASSGLEKEWEELEFAFVDADMANLKAMAGMTMAVSALNQVTGGIYKTIGGLEAQGIINEKTARQWQENARRIEMFTGPLEILISLEIMATMAGKPFLATLMAKVPAFSAVGTSALSAAAGVGAFIIAAAPFIIVGLAIVAAIILIMTHLDELKKALDYVVDGFKSLGEMVSDASGSVSGLASNVTGLGDALTDNPVTKMLGKAGGALL